jgi:hypothetical protein
VSTWAEDVADLLDTQQAEFSEQMQYTPPLGGAPALLRGTPLRQGRFEELARGQRDRVRVTGADLLAAGVTLQNGATLAFDAVNYRVARFEEVADGAFHLYLDRI